MTKEQEQAAADAAVAAFLAAGGVIQQIPMGTSGRVEGSSYSAWGRPGPKKRAEPTPDEDLEAE